jgi:subtilase family serine protease
VDVNTAYTTGFIKNGNGGAGMTGAIVDAYFNSQTEADLANFNSTYGLPPCTIASGCLTIVGQTCGAPPAQPPGPPFADGIAGWFGETDLDVQWVHAIAPNAKIFLVAANSSFFSDFIPAEACAKANADVVTNSWGGGEFSGQNSLDSAWSATIPILFSAGDAYLATEYPCTSPNVTCVGGTNLTETTTSHRNRESVWDESSGGGTGGGCSAFESEPAFQSGFSTCGSARGVPDIAAIADPYSGVVVYLGNNANNGGGAGIGIIGGTSLASPVMAGVIADIDASRVAAGKAILSGTAPFNLGSELYPAAGNPYYHYRYYDVTSGTGATAGWDDVTGLGVTLNPALTSYLDSLP